MGVLNEKRCKIEKNQPKPPSGGGYPPIPDIDGSLMEMLPRHATVRNTPNFVVFIMSAGDF